MKLAAKRIFIVVLLLPFAFGCGRDHPADDYLIQNFVRHEADFNKLVVMFNEDAGVSRVTAKEVQVTDEANPRGSPAKLSRQRWEDYRDLFSRLQITYGMARASHPAWRIAALDGAIFLVSSGKGMVAGSSEKGYVYSPTEPMPLINSLDRVDIDLKNKDMIPVYKRLKGNWYLFYREGG